MVSFHFVKLCTLLTLSRPITSLSVVTNISRNIRPAFSPIGNYRELHLRQRRINPNRSRISFAMSSSASAPTIGQEERYSMADQEARFNKAKLENNQRFLDITSVYDPSYLKGKRVAITGANRGLGLALATEVSNAGAQLIAIVRSSSPELDALQPTQIITGIDATKDEDTIELHTKIIGGPVDILINNAGYFKTEVETLDALDFADEIKTIDICAVGPLRITSSLINGKILTEGSKVIMITSQGGSVSWRPVQCADGGDYGHHVRNMRRKSISHYTKECACRCVG
jgi:short chain dehydrogenase